MRISDWSSDVCSSDLIEDRRYEDQSDSDMPFVDPIAEKKDRRAERHTDRGRGQHMAPVDAAETVGQIAAKPGADDPRDANGDAEHQSGLSRAEAVRALEQDQRPKILAIGEEGNKRSADGEVEERARSEHFA